MIKEIVGVTVPFAIAGVSFAGGMVLSNNMKDDNYAIVLAEKEDDMNALASSLSSLNDEIANRDLQIADLIASKNALQKQYDELLSSSGEDKQTIERLNGEISNLQEQIKSAGNDKESLQSQLNSKIEELLALQQQLQEKETKIDELNKNISSLTEHVENYRTQVQNLQSQYGSVKSQYDTVKQQYQELLKQSEVDKQQIQSLNDNISNLNNRISELEEEIASLKNSDNIDFDDFFSKKSDEYSFSFGIRISETRALFSSGTSLFSYDNMTGKFRKVADNLSLNLSSVHADSGYFHILSNGNVLFWDSSLTNKLALYKYNEESVDFIMLDSYYQILPMSDDNFCSKTGEFILRTNTSSSLSLFMSADGSTVLHDFGSLSFCCYSYTNNDEQNGEAIIVFQNNNSIGFYKYDEFQKTFIQIGDDVSWYSTFSTFSSHKFSNGSYLCCLSTNVYFYDPLTLIWNKLNGFEYENFNFEHKVYECSNGEVLMLMKGSQCSYVLDSNNHIVIKEFGKHSFDYSSLSFLEDESGVTISDCNGVKLRYDFIEKSLSEVKK